MVLQRPKAVRMLAQATGKVGKQDLDPTMSFGASGHLDAQRVLRSMEPKDGAHAPVSNEKCLKV